jgi:hypothetical protein
MGSGGLAARHEGNAKQSMGGARWQTRAFGKIARGCVFRGKGVFSKAKAPYFFAIRLTDAAFCGSSLFSMSDIFSYSLLLRAVVVAQVVRLPVRFPASLGTQPAEHATLAWNAADLEG